NNSLYESWFDVTGQGESWLGSKVSSPRPRVYTTSHGEWVVERRHDLDLSRVRVMSRVK
ncbi:hypothetical protein HAX54_049703, partial [Datura stramonium]|nr:hypothetical protein [Datura stramonium]